MLVQMMMQAMGDSGVFDSPYENLNFQITI
jgi:hypothetical protein